ncbi:hypothetical protein NDU88_012910 [Pleurodeles waltl]|uniref:Uncharacterized protein n=1 Tax=Pleurodeles waltl TaxID=8319 RepID=A0AAV7R1G6_PLEWA|nr:hypothetical protein NDU88_012910 [Pleurodeles waltl]
MRRGVKAYLYIGDEAGIRTPRVAMLGPCTVSGSSSEEPDCTPGEESARGRKTVRRTPRVEEVTRPPHPAEDHPLPGLGATTVADVFPHEKDCGVVLGCPGWGEEGLELDF